MQYDPDFWQHVDRLLRSLLFYGIPGNVLDQKIWRQAHVTPLYAGLGDYGCHKRGGDQVGYNANPPVPQIVTDSLALLAASSSGFVLECSKVASELP